MKETIRTASVLEIYNEAIKNYTLEKKNLQKRLNILEGGGFVRGVGGCLAIITIIFFFIAGIIGALGPSHSDYDGQRIVSIVFVIIAIVLAIVYAKSSERSAGEREQEIKHLKERIAELNKEIEDRETRKKSLLEAEEVIVAKDLKSVKDKIETENFKEIIPESNTKICPMCAETVKAAAKICRYCSHKFE